VAAVVEAWYPGSRGAEAIARLLYGDIDAMGRLPVTFAASMDQLPRPAPPAGPMADVGGRPTPQPFDLDYKEGSSIGYRWFAETGAQPRFPFGFGLSYTRFAYSAPTVTGGKTIKLSVAVKNTGRRAGVETVQLYLKAAPNRAQQRLLGWAKAPLKAGESRRVTITVDPRLLADWDVAAHSWRVAGGAYQVFIGPNASKAAISRQVRVAPAVLRP
jgi:beta-glucosidase